jgi:hypothetical protein
LITVIRELDGTLKLYAKLVAPVIYLDHCALVEFANNDAYRARLITTLKSKSGTLLLSQANFFEAAGFQNRNQALRIETLLNDLIPNVFVADFMKDPGFFFINGGPNTHESPEMHWLARHLLEAAAANNGNLTFSNMFTEVVAQHGNFSWLLKDMKEHIAAAVAQHKEDPAKIAEGKNFVPDGRMPVQHLLMAAILRDTQINISQKFSPNDSMDLIHAVPSASVSDFVLLDKAWCHRFDRAAAYIAGHGITKKYPKRYWCRPDKIQEFFEELEKFDSSKEAT